ncbi:DUF2817 domain-containing protein [Patescibacteria group bacterium]|nr:DUF2817 domain-containing protein [Patescibacteria group bacterium]
MPNSVTTPLPGIIEVAIAEEIKKKNPYCELTTCCLEFGTFPKIRIGWALRNDNWLHHYGDIESRLGIMIKEKMYHIFFPDDKEWRMNLLVSRHRDHPTNTRRACDVPVKRLIPKPLFL